MSACRVYLHPATFACRAAEIARSQGARVELDAYGRPFIPAADPLGEGPPAASVNPGRFCAVTAAPVDPLAQPGRFAWLIGLMHALGREAGPPSPGRHHKVPP